MVHQRQQGMTLLELLTVVSILATLAGAVIYRLDDMHAQSLESLAVVEMTRIKKAVLQFERDTGRRPVMSTSPVDFDEFFDLPPDLTLWNISTQRGWRGPYLDKPAAVGHVDIGSGLTATGSGDPLGGSYLVDVPAVADPFTHPPLWAKDSADNPHWYFNWITAGIPGPQDGDTAANTPRGRPYALFDMTDTNKARLLSFGPNGVYESGGGDDLVLCLYRSGC